MTETKYQLWRDWLDRIAAHLQASGTHAARSVVLLPYAQLMPVAERLWAQFRPQGFTPRFETTLSWSRSLGGTVPTANDISFDAALDVLTAGSLLAQAGLGAHAELAGRLMETAHQLAPLAAAVPPAQRSAWGQRARSTAQSGMDGEMLALESALAQTAVAWAASSGYASDVLFATSTLQAADCLIVLQGLLADPLTDALQSAWGERMTRIEMSDAMPQRKALGHTSFHQARDAQDEAQRAAACVLTHVNAGRVPVALVATDRALTRRVRAMLEGAGLSLRDENGWKLSTSRSGAHVMGALRACAWDASSDAVLDWLKNSPLMDTAALRSLEAALRRQPQRTWRHVPAMLEARADAALADLLAEVMSLREPLNGTRTLDQWLAAWRTLLQHTGQWTPLQDDVAGAEVLAALRLDPSTARLPDDAPWARRRLSLSEFTHWADQVLESQSFRPQYPAQEQVVILPLAQMLARPFAAAVIPGCDEVRLNPSPEPPGPWTSVQRAALGLPSREALDAILRACWREALTTPQVDLLWRASDDGGEPLLPSALVQQIRLEAGDGQADDPRDRRTLDPAPVARPAPVASQLPIVRVSASAYQDLRHCPYRFFALRQLGLKEAEEIEGELDKRDFGQWLHAVLKRFHDDLCASPSSDTGARRSLLDAAARRVTQERRLAEDEFLPFLAAWPRVRDGYLEWLAGHEADGLRYTEGERQVEQPLGALTLVGRLDRIDQSSEGEVMVIDYKTESPTVTRKRTSEPFEDTQLAFYAALLPHDTLRAAYVNVGEREGSKTIEQKDVVEVRDALLERIVSDMQRIADGVPMPALGEGQVCDFCAARGLCRKDFWADEALAGSDPA